MPVAPVGSCVRLEGLSTAPRLNGRVGCVVGHSHDGRALVRLTEGESEASGRELLVRAPQLARFVPTEEDDAAATARMEQLRRTAGHVVPAGWPRDRIDCPACARRHERHLCCQSSTSSFEPPHTGQLELVSWTFSERPVEGESEAAAEGMTAEMERLVAAECGWDYGATVARWPRAFRWTCCGRAPDSRGRCEHHGARRGAWCTCDPCRSGRHDLVRFTPSAHNRLLVALHAPCPPARDAWAVVAGIPWSARSHALFPRPFRARTFALLCARARGAAAAADASASLLLLGRLDEGVMLLILGHLAGPPPDAAIGG